MQPVDSPLSLEELVNKAQDLEKQGKFENAKGTYHEVINRDFSYAQAHIGLGNIFFRAKEFERAAEAYRHGIESRPNSAYAYFKLGQIEKIRKNYIISIDYLSKAIALNHQNWFFYKEIGEVYIAQDRLDDAETVLKRSIALNPDVQDAYFKLGVVFQKQKKLDDALKSFELLLKLDSSHPRANQRLGDIYAQKENWNNAIIYYRKAIELKNGDPFLHARLARSLCGDNQIGEAIKYWRSAICLKSNRYQFHEQLGDLLLHQEKIEEAYSSYERAVALKPDSYTLQKKLKKLKKALRRQSMVSAPVDPLSSVNLVSTETAQIETPQAEVQEKRLLESEFPMERESQVTSRQAIEDMSRPQLDSRTEPGFLESSNFTDSKINQPLGKDTESPGNISDARMQNFKHFPAFKEKKLVEPKKLTSAKKNSGEMSEQSVVNASSRNFEKKTSALKLDPIDLNLTETAKQGRSQGKSGQVPFSKHKRRGAKSNKLDNTGFQKGFSFSAEGVGGYDESIPKPVKKILLFLLLGFYGAIALFLFLKGLTVLGIFLVVIAALIILIFWGFRKLQSM